MIYINQTTYNFFMTSTIVVLFFIDLGQFFLIGTPIIPFLLCIYCIFLLHDPKTYPSYNEYLYLFILALLQCLEFFCFYNFFSLALLFLIPITGLAFIIKKNFYPSVINLITLSCIGSILQIYAAESYLLSALPATSYTIIRISAILLSVISFSLIINIWGMQDNRA